MVRDRRKEQVMKDGGDEKQGKRNEMRIEKRSRKTERTKKKH